MLQTEEKLTLFRTLMKDAGINAFIIPNTDPHLGEYITDHWRIVHWFTGFTGSAATVVITDSFAGLWSDSRYFVQAEKQIFGSGFKLMKPDQDGTVDCLQWVADNLEQESLIALDGRTFSIGNLRKLNILIEGKRIKVDIESDLVYELWKDPPPLTVAPAYEHPVSFCGKERALKIAEVRNEMLKLKTDYHLLTSPDDIMWLLNIRGNDLKYSPLMLSFALVGEEQILLFVNEDSIPLKIAREFDRHGIVMLPYEETGGMLSTLPAGSSILITPATISAALFNSIPSGVSITEDISIPTRLKAIKNKVEIENIGNVMVKDGVALTKFFFWIEKNAGSVPMSELSLTEKLNHLRSGLEDYLQPSFSAIIAYNEHAALPHYSATSATDSVIGLDGILLIDSGGQYLDGTTDITRTISIGSPTSIQKSDFTLVLKGMIGLAMAKFPQGTRGYQLDVIARKYLWEHGLNYGHGTGHGVGYCLNVHEGPQSISPFGGNDPKISIEAGMLISDEPGIYREGEYGIRIENLILCRDEGETEFGRFLKFDTVSLCYIDKSLIDISMLDQKETTWLNSYHVEVFEKLSPYLTPEERKWLKSKTEYISTP
jgi:Xaa-Pro aminopeptidase